MAQWSQVLAAPTKDLVELSAPTRGFTTAYSSSSRASSNIFLTFWTSGMHVLHRHTCKRSHIHIK